MVGWRGILSAQYLVGKAIRDGVSLSRFDTSTLPRMMLAMSVVSIMLAVAHTTVAARLAPGTLVPTLFTVSAFLFIVGALLGGLLDPNQDFVIRNPRDACRDRAQDDASMRPSPSC